MKVKQLRIILGFFVLLISFQNCNSPKAPETQTNSTSKDGKTSSSSMATGSAHGTNGLNSGSARNISGGSSGGGGTSGGSFGGISGGGSGSGGSSTGSGSGGSGTCLGCGTGGGSGSGGGGTGGGTGGGGIGGGGDVTFKITTQPISKTIPEGTEFFVGISFQGGRTPFTFKWYRNNEEIPPIYGDVHYETYSTSLDRIYKEGDYHVVVTDGLGAKLTSNKAQIRMTSKMCQAGKYFIDLTKRNPTSTSDPYAYFNDLFYYKNTKYLVSQYNPTVAMMQLPNMGNNIGVIGFSYFNLGGNVSNSQSFSIECSTDVPTIHTSECSFQRLDKCPYSGDNDPTATQNYEGTINFTCRNGYIEFVSNTCRLVTPPPPPDNGGGGG